MENRFNIRVYGIWINDNKLLVNEEQIRQKAVVKLPGGGLDWGEGTIACLRREWQEELGIDIEVTGHFYTTDFFQASAFDNSQVISVYYRVQADPQAPIINHISNERTFWAEMQSISADSFTLPIDKVVGRMLQQQYAGGTL